MSKEKMIITNGHTVIEISYDGKKGRVLNEDVKELDYKGKHVGYNVILDVNEFQPPSENLDWSEWQDIYVMLEGIDLCTVMKDPFGYGNHYLNSDYRKVNELIKGGKNENA